MIEVHRTIATTPERVFAVLADGWFYAGWVVGASHIRQVDDDWPAVGTRIHHSIGAWPVQVKDVSIVRAVEPFIGKPGGRSAAGDRSAVDQPVRTANRRGIAGAAHPRPGQSGTGGVRAGSAVHPAAGMR